MSETAKNLSNAIKKLYEVCDESQSGTRAYDYGSQGYKDSVRHFLASSSDAAQLAVQPGSAEDLAKVVKVIKKYRVPFAVKGGGHSMVPGFSSTPGIQIAMTLFNKVEYDEKTQLVDVGAGCLWDEVYGKLARYNRNAIGGAARQGVGVAGWMLGGGYSLKSNQYGLGIDNVVKYEVVLPDGKIVTATADNRKDLFHALRGGGNNFGIVTQFTLKTHPQGPTYGASLMIPGTKSNVTKVKDAIVDFVKKETRPQAALVVAFRHGLSGGGTSYTMSAFCVFDGKKPSKSKDIPFSKFRKIVKDDWTADPAGWLANARILSGVDRSKFVKKRVSTRSSRAIGDADEDADDYGFREMDYSDVNEMSAHPYDMPIVTVAPARASRGIGGDSDDSDVDDLAVDDLDLSDSEDVPSDTEFIVDLSAPSEAENTRGTRAPRKKTKEVDIKTTMAYTGEENVRGRFGCIMVTTFTAKLVDVVAAEAERAAKSLKERRGVSVIIDIWPFVPAVFDNSPSGAAWPHKKGEPFGPLLAYFRWSDPKDDSFWLGELKKSLNAIRKVALDEGCTTDNPPYYSNTSLEDVPVKRIYRGNLKSLGQVRKKYDPDDVMSLTGGYRIPLAD